MTALAAGGTCCDQRCACCSESGSCGGARRSGCCGRSSSCRDCAADSDGCCQGHGSPSRRLDAKSSFLVRTRTLVTDLSTGTDRTLVTEMRRLSIITGAGRVLVMGAYTGPDGSVERRTSSYAKTHMRHPRADLVAFLGSTNQSRTTANESGKVGGCERVEFRGPFLPSTARYLELLAHTYLTALVR
jgi:hypothetical protein